MEATEYPDLMRAGPTHLNIADYISNIGDALMYDLYAPLHLLDAGVHPDYISFSSQDCGCLKNPSAV
jgi:hypothetical protein